MEEDIITLQELVAHQSLEIEQLSGELHMQQKEVKQLQLQMKKLRADMEDSANDDPRQSLPEPPPPHY